MSVDNMKLFKDKLEKPLNLKGNEDFSIIRQNKIFNNLPTVQTNKRNTKTVITDDKQIKTEVTNDDNTIILTLEKKLKDACINPTTHKMLDFIMLSWSADGARAREFEFSLQDFMQLFQLNDKKHAKEQIDKHIDQIANISCIKTGQASYLWLFEEIKPTDDKQGFQITFTPKFYDKYVKPTRVMYYPNTLFAIDTKKYPHAYNIGRKFASHRRINQNKNSKNIDTLSIRNLLPCCPKMPTYNEVMKSNRDIKGRIYEPFLQNLNALDEVYNIFGYDLEYNKEPIDTETALQLNYTEFKKINVRITWSNYPQIETNYKPNKRKSKENTTK